MPSNIRLHRVFKTTPERLYKAFTNPDALVKWMAPHGFTAKVHSMDLRKGGSYRMSLAYVQAEPAQAKAAMMQHGFSASAAAMFEEMSAAFSARRLDGEYEKGPTEIAPTTQEQFASAVFRPAFEASARVPA